MWDNNNNHILATSITWRANSVPSANQDCCICRVTKPNRNQQDARNVYAPKVFPIGPFHRQINVSLGQGRGMGLDYLKSCYLRSFLELNQALKEDDYIEALGNLEGRSRRCYGEQIFQHSNEFMEMLLVDGCFIIMLFLKFKRDMPRSPEDPIFYDASLLKVVQYDLLLFENQIPFCVLQCLYNIAGLFNKGPSLVELALNFFNPIIPRHRELDPADCIEVKHLLDLIRRSYAPSLPEILSLENYSPMELEYGAWVLKHKAAVRFKKNKKAKSLLDVKFRFDAVMEIPQVKNIETIDIFLNCIAYEQHCGGPDSYISDYVSFMASLLKNSRDAGVLQKSGISSFLVLNDFTFLSSKCVLRNSHYSQIYKKVNRHCDSTWRILLAVLWHDLLSFPVVIPFGLAVILVVWFVKYLFSFL